MFGHRSFSIELVGCPGDSEGCHSEEPFNSAQDELCDEESQDGRNNMRFFASTAFRLRMTTPQILVDEALGSVNLPCSKCN
jgi:hypothetical protein